MIRVYRPSEPLSFLQQRMLWQKELQEATNKLRPSSITEIWRRIRQRKAMQEYARLLFAAFHHKCAFCESQPRHVSPLHIEHYRPKSTGAFQSYMFDWSNWLVACMTCNGNKGEHFDNCADRPCLLDPTAEEPGEHIDFLEAQIIPKTIRGKKTVEQIQLNRLDLVQTRTLWLLNIKSLLIVALRVPEAYAPARELLLWAMQDDAPYAAMTRIYLRQQAPKLANPVTAHPVVNLIEPYSKLADILNRYNRDLQDLLE